MELQAGFHMFQAFTMENKWKRGRRLCRLFMLKEPLFSVNYGMLAVHPMKVNNKLPLVFMVNQSFGFDHCMQLS